MNGIYQTDKTIILLVILFKIVWKIWNRPSPIKLVEEKEEVEVSKGLKSRLWGLCLVSWQAF